MIVSVRNTDIYFTHLGAGPAIVLLHGFLEDSSIFLPFQKALSSRFQVVLIDLPGHGKSGTQGYVNSMDAMADVVNSVLLELKIASCVLIGHSMGGYVALAFAERYASKLEGFGLFHSTAVDDSSQKKIDRERTIKLVMRNSGTYIDAAIPALFAEANKSRFQHEIAQLIEAAKTYTPQGIVANIRGMMGRPDRSNVLRDTQLPVLIIQGAEDPIISAETIRQQATLSSQITCHEIPNIGHMGYLEAPDICMDFIGKFAERAFAHD